MRLAGRPPMRRRGSMIRWHSLASRFHARSLLTTIQVRFIGEVPSSIWQFTGASPFARPQAANQYNRTHLDAQQRATLTQRDVHGGLFGGFGWEW